MNKNIVIIKSWIRDVYSYMLFLRNSSKNYAIEKGRIYAVVNWDENLKYNDFGRYFYLSCMYFKEAGFDLIVKTNWRDFRKPMHFKKSLLQQAYTFVRNCSTPLNTIVLVQPGKPSHIIHFRYGFETSSLTNKLNCIAPYPMHPSQIRIYSSKTFSIDSRRIIKIFFAGNTNPKAYNTEKVKIFFDVLSRREIIETVLSGIGKSRRLQNDSDKLALNQMLSSDEYFNEVIISEVKTEEGDWLKVLSKTDFFLCPPGQSMPWCHNCVEAMAVGAIPILEYAELFSPHLKNLENCLSFSNKRELQMAIEKALRMEPSEIERMRKNVLTYFRDHLSLDSITKKIKTFSESEQQELEVALPFIPTEKERSFIRKAEL